MNSLLKLASRINSIPVINLLAPNATRQHSAEECAGFLATQSLSQRCADEVSRLLKPGWTEKHTSALMETWLRDHGVKTFFHKPFVWWGDRTRFKGVKNYWDYLPTTRCLQEGDVFILDVAPYFRGFVADIGFSGIIGENQKYSAAMEFLESIRADIPKMAKSVRSGSELFARIDRLITENGYENIHKTYPFGVLGHRLHQNHSDINSSFIHFGVESYWDLLSRGLFGQLLNKDFTGSLRGVWAIEPHIGVPEFGVKFEEILVVDDEGARWLNPVGYYRSQIGNEVI